MRLVSPLLFVLITFACLSADEPAKIKSDVAKSDVAKSDASTEAEPVSFWMEKKLQYSQGILRGLATGNLEEVAAKADQMRLVSKVEGWIRNRKPGYRAQFRAFEFSNAEILRNARAGNLDGATIGFQQLTISCVSCHKLIRDVD